MKNDVVNDYSINQNWHCASANQNWSRDQINAADDDFIWN